MSDKHSAMKYISTTGAGIAVGTNIDLGGFMRGSDLAGTLVVSASAGVLFTISASQVVTFATPIACNGPITMTTSAGDHFVVWFRQRPQ